MFEGLKRLSVATRLLDVEDRPLTDRLYEAAVQLAIALTRPDQWPRDLHGEAEQLGRQLTVNGSIRKKLDNIDEETAHDLSRQLQKLAGRIQDAMSKHLPSGDT